MIQPAAAFIMSVEFLPAAFVLPYSLAHIVLTFTLYLTEYIQ
jgi:hypothetical protein